LFLIIILFDISALSKITAQNIPRSNKTIASKKQKDPKRKTGSKFLSGERLRKSKRVISAII